MIPGKSATKAVDKEYRRLGATRKTVLTGVEYLFPDGARKLVPANTRWGIAHQMIHEARDRYPSDDRPPMGGERVKLGDVPVIDFTKLTVTEHATQRNAEMAAQDTLTAAEVMHALTIPHYVLWMEKHGTYAWCGERVAVVGHVRDGWLTIRTLLWTTTELWDRNPRPEKETIT